jgi:hypothetical protein|tara:strand:+ start:774 stop:1337 length:564 start_codon:yes stop_codon:yes gene_type:complete
MLLHGYNPSDGSFTGTSKFSNPVMEEAQKGDAIIVDDFAFVEAADLYETDGQTFTLIAGWEAIKAERNQPPAPTVTDIITERERRLAAGFDYDFADARGVHTIGTTKADLDGWDEVSKAASALVALGLPDQSISIVTDTGPCDVTAIEWQSVLVAAMQFRQPIFAASFVLQYSDPIPQDYADDVNWA